MAENKTPIKLTNCVMDCDLLKGDIVVVYNIALKKYSNPMNYLGRSISKSVDNGWPIFGRDDWSNILNPYSYLFYVQ
jgi:hypothetical protein